MLGRLNVFFLALWLIALGGASFFFFPIREKDRKQYHNLTSVEGKPEKRPPFIQNRRQVRKDLFLDDKGERKQIRIESDSSKLYFQQEKNQFIEELNQIHCLIEDRHEEDKFLIRELVSEEGIYNFSRHKFTSNEVDMALIEVNGNPFMSSAEPLTTLLQGRAKKMTLAFEKEGLELKAHHFKAKVSSEIKSVIDDFESREH